MTPSPSQWPRAARCSRSSNSLSAHHAASFRFPVSGRGKKLLPFSANEPHFAPSIRLRTAYFQYAACSVSSLILWRPGPGRHAACLGYSAYRLPKIWSVPGALFVGLMQQGKDQLRRFHGDFPRDLHDWKTPEESRVHARMSMRFAVSSVLDLAGLRRTTRMRGVRYHL